MIENSVVINFVFYDDWRAPSADIFFSTNEIMTKLD